MKKITRRQALGTAVGAATAVGLAALVTWDSAKPSPTPDPKARPDVSASGLSIPADGIDEVFEGRRIQISLAKGGGGHEGHGLPAWPTIKIDGKELHVMRNADGTWVSVVNHYESFPDPVAAARAAVRTLQGAHLAPFAPEGAAQ
ncbi:tyrosinase family oxidase copper chaperone [Streptomyces sp. NPDC059851]|uniref:apotyrosinase chaperone MelC1 n=1 Tax=Streptomyces sp. NPDC059851 TaxID=3346971 RepID=UPI00365C7CAE